MGDRVHQEDPDKLHATVTQAEDVTIAEPVEVVQDTAADFNNTEVNSADIETAVEAIEVDTGNMDTSLNNIETDTGNMDTSLNNIETDMDVLAGWDNAASDGGSVSGDTAHSGVDAGEPVKIGGKAINYQPDSEGEQGPAEVTANDRVNSAMNLRGEIVECVKCGYEELTEIDQIYDADPTTDVSSNYECWQYRQCTLSFELDVANTPTDFLFEVEVSCDNAASWSKLMNDFLGLLIYNAAAVGAGITESLTFPIACTHIRVRVTAVGTDATDTFTLDDTSLYFRN